MPPTKPRQTILVIDDDPTNLKVAVEYLKAYSYKILIARDGETGIERAQLARPDLILLDVQMPGIDGYETCRRLGANPDNMSYMTGFGVRSPRAPLVVDMLALAGSGVALHAKPSVAERAAIRIDHADLTALLYLQGYRKAEFVGE